MFVHFVIGLVLATYGFYQFSEFPSIAWLVASLILLVIAGLYRHVIFKFSVPRSAYYFLIGVIIGFQGAFLQSVLSPVLPSIALNQSVVVFGEVIGLPTYSQTSSFNQQIPSRQRVRFDFKVSKIQVNDQEFNWEFNRPKIRLSWFSPNKTIQSGKNKQFLVKLRSNRASFNLGGFDYETHLFKESIQATGHVLNPIVTTELSTELSTELNTELSEKSFHLRFWLAQHLESHLENSQFKGIFKALIYGERSDISNQDWEMLRQTGTIHLMAISGLHIGLIAGIGFLLFGALWSVLIIYSRWVFNTPKVYFAAIGALLFASVYLVLAGASIPTQRAWLMVVSVLVFVLMKRKFQPVSALALAAFLVVIWEPKSVLSPGFWLSFTAVALIFATLAYIKNKSFKKWQIFLIIQVILTVGLSPFVAFYYHQFPVYSIIANLIAVPFVTMIGLPLLFLTVMVSFVSDLLTGYLMWLNNFLWHWLWIALYWVANLKFNVMPLSISIWQLAIFYAGVFILLSRANSQRFIIGMAMMVFAVMFGFRLESDSNIRMTLLDVGQAQAVVFTTKNHTILYDTGNYWNQKLDGGKMAILPYLKVQGRQQLDLMIVSHSDKDHAGGANSILKEIAVKESLSGQPKKLNSLTGTTVFKSCIAGQTWQFDELKVEVLAPLASWGTPKKDNDASCVVKFSVNDATILITGDLGQRYERKLVRAIREKLTADILIAGHHGSKTASSYMLLNQVKPSVVLFTTGYLNRFNHPDPKVINKVAAAGANWWNTACEGSITYKYNEGAWLKQQSYRKINSKWYHHRCSPAEKGIIHQGAYN